MGTDTVASKREEKGKTCKAHVKCRVVSRKYATTNSHLANYLANHGIFTKDFSAHRQVHFSRWNQGAGRGSRLVVLVGMGMISSTHGLMQLSPMDKLIHNWYKERLITRNHNWCKVLVFDPSRKWDESWILSYPFVLIAYSVYTCLHMVYMGLLFRGSQMGFLGLLTLAILSLLQPPILTILNLDEFGALHPSVIWNHIKSGGRSAKCSWDLAICWVFQPFWMHDEPLNYWSC